MQFSKETEERILSKYLSSKKNIEKKVLVNVNKKDLKELHNLYIEKQKLLNHIKELDLLIFEKEVDLLIIKKQNSLNIQEKK